MIDWLHLVDRYCCYLYSACDSEVNWHPSIPVYSNRLAPVNAWQDCAHSSSSSPNQGVASYQKLPPSTEDYMDSQRATKLQKQLDAIVHGRQKITLQNSSLFLEAICAQQDRPACISKLIASKAGLEAIQASMRFNLDPNFFNGHAAALLTYLRAPELKEIASGKLLNEIILKIVDPPIFWDSFFQSFSKGLLVKDGQLSFVWLLHHLVTLPPPLSNVYREQAPAILSLLLASSDLAARAFGQKIKHILETCSVGAVVIGEDGPGGRHDNDFVDFRDIAILPTCDEISSPEPPFLRHCAALDDPSIESTRLATHLDNQFRLLREDMLYEMREELQIALKKKKGYHRGLILNDLLTEGLHCGPDNKRCKWGITLQCKDDLPQLKGVKDRKKALAENRNILRHQSLACLLIDGEIIAFPTVHRDEELLAGKPPVVVLQLEGEVSTAKTILKLKTAKVIGLIQIDTAIFSYAPILNALQRIAEMPLSPELLGWKEGIVLTEAISQSLPIVQALRFNPQYDLQRLLKTPKSIKLDNSQAASLVSGLTQRVSLIQGPPGRFFILSYI